MEQTHGALMVVVTIIAKLTFQVGTNPPRGIWKINSNSAPAPIGPKIYTSILSYDYDQRYTHVMLVAFCSIAFSAYPHNNNI